MLQGDDDVLRVGGEDAATGHRHEQGQPLPLQPFILQVQAKYSFIRN